MGLQVQNDGFVKSSPAADGLFTKPSKLNDYRSAMVLEIRDVPATQTVFFIFPSFSFSGTIFDRGGPTEEIRRL
jgi:hypothetical protein